jgi:hypothetical protein
VQQPLDPTGLPADSQALIICPGRPPEPGAAQVVATALRGADALRRGLTGPCALAENRVQLVDQPRTAVDVAMALTLAGTVPRDVLLVCWLGPVAPPDGGDLGGGKAVIIGDPGGLPLPGPRGVRRELGAVLLRPGRDRRGAAGRRAPGAAPRRAWPRRGRRAPGAAHPDRAPAGRAGRPGRRGGRATRARQGDPGRRADRSAPARADRRGPGGPCRRPVCCSPSARPTAT